MKTCPNCQNLLSDEQFQCDRCGMVVAQPFCFNCRAPIDDIGTNFCTNCGAPFSMPFGIPYFQMTGNEGGTAPAQDYTSQEAQPVPPGYPLQPDQPVQENNPAQQPVHKPPNQAYVPPEIPAPPAEEYPEETYADAFPGAVPGCIPDAPEEPARQEEEPPIPGMVPGCVPDEPRQTEPEESAYPGVIPGVVPGGVPEEIPQNVPAETDFNPPEIPQESMPQQGAELAPAPPAHPPVSQVPVEPAAPPVQPENRMKPDSYKDFLAEESEEDEKEEEKAPRARKKTGIIIACVVSGLAVAAALILLMTGKPSDQKTPGQQENTPAVSPETISPEPKLTTTPESAVVPPTATPEEQEKTTPVPTAEPTGTPTLATEPTETPTQSPTATPVPTMTPTPESTATPKPTATPVPATPVPTADPEPEKGAEEGEEEPETHEHEGQEPEGTGEHVIANSFPVLGKTNIKKVNVRAKPDSSGRRIEYITNPGTIVNLLGKSKDKNGKTWYRIKTSNGSTGYILADNVIVEPEGAGDKSTWTEELQEQENRFPFQAKTTAKKVILRFKPDSKSRRVTFIQKKGTPVTILEETSDKQGIHWYKVKLQNGTTGYGRIEYFEQE